MTLSHSAQDAGWSGLSAAQQTALLKQSFDAFEQMLWNTTLDESKALAPHARWGNWDLPPRMFSSLTSDWDSVMEEMDWLWPQLGAFLPAIYPRFYVGEKRPPLLKPDCGQHNQSELDAYFSNTVAAHKRLRARIGRDASDSPIVAYIWYHYMCDQHVSHQGQPNFADMANIEASLAQPSLSGADGIVLWGSSRPAPADDKHDTIVATARFLNRTYPPLLARYCRRVHKNDDAAPSALAAALFVEHGSATVDRSWQAATSTSIGLPVMSAKGEYESAQLVIVADAPLRNVSVSIEGSLPTGVGAKIAPVGFVRAGPCPFDVEPKSYGKTCPGGKVGPQWWCPTGVADHDLDGNWKGPGCVDYAYQCRGCAGMGPSVCCTEGLVVGHGPATSSESGPVQAHPAGQALPAGQVHPAEQAYSEG